ncbi:MAG: hypothetical protein ACK4PN_03405 [Allorhizobium sp.]
MTSQNNRPQFTSYIDTEGRKVMRVPLDKRGKEHATVLERDYLNVRRSGATGTWIAHRVNGRTYVQTNIPTGAGYTLGTIARIITGAGRGVAIRYADGNPLNLLPENLVWRKGKAKRCDHEIALAGAAA